MNTKKDKTYFFHYFYAFKNSFGDFYICIPLNIVQFLSKMGSKD